MSADRIPIYIAIAAVVFIVVRLAYRMMTKRRRNKASDTKRGSSDRTR